MVVSNINTQESLKIRNNAKVSVPLQTTWLSKGETLAGCHFKALHMILMCSQGRAPLLQSLLKMRIIVHSTRPLSLGGQGPSICILKKISVSNAS